MGMNLIFWYSIQTSTKIEKKVILIRVNRFVVNKRMEGKCFREANQRELY